MNYFLNKLTFISLSILFVIIFSCGGEGEKKENSQTETLISNPHKASKVSIFIKWETTKLPLQMEIREPSGEQNLVLWTTGSVKEGKRAPFGDLIPESLLILKPGSKKQFLLVMKNPTDRAVYFFAAPHSAMPAEHSFGFKFKCLCVNHAFTVPPKETWYRVVEIRLAPDFLGDQLTLTHNLIGISRERMLQFEKSAGKSIPNEMD
ncbi:hypothetical protein EHQ68_11275 [Leptospira congkakensis]|uniref:Lipoprotein n=1 Tax=Leptospira congkakensis TaxID=2484932 RepID=A0A4Z1AB58_9LEPT|nr:hypothetical protein [Leptospira congkakensis]TGL87134.1 hypothetical protein EHQ68_11275 [Leptospira congkakensis]TGL96702.1 hypothetical protein EHQ69_00220 [Leptospira congkakensis]TGL97551.1 hypothetical protein EHQ70_05875 [Leptospira congkakensis]